MNKYLKISLGMVMVSLFLWFMVVIYQQQTPDFITTQLQQGQTLRLPIQHHWPKSNQLEPTPDAAIKAWKYMRDTYAKASNEPTAKQHSLPLLQGIWHQWPASSVAIKAQLFLLHLLKPQAEQWQQQANELMLAAIDLPHLFFSKEYQNSMQVVAVDLIQYLQQKNHLTQAWSWCLRLRWAMPRIDTLAPECHSLLKNHPSLPRTPQASLALAPSYVDIKTFPNKKLKPQLINAVHHFLSQPYDAATLSAAIVEIKRAGFPLLAKILIEEHVQIDPEHTYKLELE